MNEEHEHYAQDFIYQRKFDIFLLTIGAAIGVFFNWTIVEIGIFLVFLWSFLGPLSSRFLMGCALFFLPFMPVFLLLKKPERAEEFSVYMYYFLMMAVIQGIIEIRGEKKEKIQTD